MDRNILFLCTGNSARSQMGEALLRAHAGDRFEAYSAGTEPRAQIFPPVIRAMREVGIDIADRKPKGIREFLGRVHFEKVIIVCREAENRCPAIFGLSQRLLWPFEDPSAAAGSPEDVLDIARRVRDRIDRRICEWLAEQGIPAEPLHREEEG